MADICYVHSRLGFREEAVEVGSSQHLGGRARITHQNISDITDLK